MKHLYLVMVIIASAMTSYAQNDVTFTLTDSESGAPIQDAEIILDGNFFGYTNANGVYVFTDFADGNFFYSITAACYEFESGNVLVSGSSVEIDAELNSTTTNNVFFFVGSPFTLSGAEVILSGDGYFNSITTGAPFGDIMENVPYGTYSYTITAPCYEMVTGTVTVECNGGDGMAVFAEPAEATTNNVFFFVGSPFTLSGAEVILSGDGYFNSITTGAPFGDIMENVPYGTYSYTITAPCYEMVTGTVTVECNGGDGMAVFAEPEEATTNNVFFFVGSPLTISGATVVLTGDGGFSQTLETGAPFGDIMENVPYGDYAYTITADCYTTVTGEVTVDCANGDGVAVFAEPEAITISTEVIQDGNMLTAPSGDFTYQWIDCATSLPIDGATSQSFVAGQNGTYAVEISTENCTATSECTEVSTLGINDRAHAIEMTIYPNPFISFVKIDSDALEGKVEVSVINMTGAILRSQTFQSGSEIKMDLSELSQGVYLIHVNTADGVRSLKVLKQ